MSRYDAIIIGSGQAGNPLAHALAEHGWNTALIEKENLGGTCINTGCTPTKTMVACAQVAHYARSAAKWGVRASDVGVDLPRVIAIKDRIVGQFRSRLDQKARDRKNLTLIRESARFLAPDRVSVGNQELESNKIFINTGTRPAVPRIEGLDGVGYLTNATLMQVKAI